MWDYGHPCGFLVRRTGLEPTIPCLKGKCLTNLATGAYKKKLGGVDALRPRGTKITM